MEQTIAILGGDGRYLELIRQLQQLPATHINLIGFDKLERGFTGSTQIDFHELQPEKLDAVILPITGIQTTGEIDTTFSDQQVILSKVWFKRLRPGTIVFTGIANSYLTTLARDLELELIALFDRDDVAIYNSIPTAEGAIMMAIEHTDYTIHSSRVMVVGFGRVGHTVANKFHALGADVSVCANHIKDLARITEMGFRAIPMEKMAEHTEACDLLINTVPAFVVKEKAIQQLPSHALIYDLASKPGGTDFAYAEKRGVKAILARSLPGIVAPKTSGRILADVVKQFLKNGKERR